MKLLTCTLFFSITTAACGGKTPTTTPDIAATAPTTPATATPDIAATPAADGAAAAGPDAAATSDASAVEATAPGAGDAAPGSDAAVAADVAPPAPVVPSVIGSEHVIWYVTASGQLESAWIRATAADAYEVVATRPEAVVSDGKTVWAVQRTARAVPLANCPDDGEDEPKPPPPDAETTLVRGLAVRPLGPGTARDLVPLSTKRFLVGEWTQPAIALRGSVGDRIIYHDTAAWDSCGIHPDGGSSTAVGAAHGGESVGAWRLLRDRMAERVKDMTAKVLAASDEEGCKGFWVETDTDADVHDLSLRKAGDRLATVMTWALWTDAHAYVSCEISLDEAKELGALKEFPEASAAVRKALLERAADGPVGYAELPADEAARAAALAAFKDASTVYVPPVEATANGVRPALDEARRLTADKHYPEAIAAFQAIIAEQPKLAQARSGLGYAQLMAGDVKNAVANFNVALELESQPSFRAAVLFNLGSAFERQGDKTVARDYYTKSLAAKKTKAARAALERLK